jgi:hypothetical protein
MTGRRSIRILSRAGLRFQLFLRQIAAAVAGLLLLASPLSESLHTVFVPHAICAEHGEVVHVQAAHEAFNGPRATDSAPSLGTDGVAPEAGHEHCPVVAASSRRTAQRGNAEALLLPAAIANDEARIDRVVRPSTSIGLVLLAPKTSPPIPA